MSILVADDSRFQVALLTKALREKGFEVVAAQDAMQAGMVALRTAPDAIVLDINMPGCSGIEVLKRRGTQKSDRTSSPAPTETKVYSRAVLPGCGGTEHQATGPLPQPSAKAAARRDDLVSNPRKKLSLTAVLTSHQLPLRATLFQQPRDVTPIMRDKGLGRAPWASVKGWKIWWRKAVKSSKRTLKAV